MNGDSESFLSLPEQDRRDIFEAAAVRLDTLPDYVEKDFWVCVVLDILYHGVSEEHPQLLFKGGTSLSKAFGLIDRFSEDIDLVVHRAGLGFSGQRDPTVASNLSNNKRAALFKELKATCGDYVQGDLRTALTKQVDEMTEGCRVGPDEDDADRQTLVVEYPTLFPSLDVPYVTPRVRIEAGARSALEPSSNCTVTPYLAEELPGWSFDVGDITVIAPERTYWEKLLILHGVYCGYRDGRREPADKDRISRHYYDSAMITPTETGRSALSNTGLLDDVRNHNLIAFPQPRKRFNEAVPGSVRLVPPTELLKVIERDYRAMRGMILGDVPDFRWIVEQLQRAEAAINNA